MNHDIIDLAALRPRTGIGIDLQKILRIPVRRHERRQIRSAPLMETSANHQRADKQNRHNQRQVDTQHNVQARLTPSPAAALLWFSFVLLPVSGHIRSLNLIMPGSKSSSTLPPTISAFSYSIEEKFPRHAAESNIFCIFNNRTANGYLRHVAAVNKRNLTRRFIHADAPRHRPPAAVPAVYTNGRPA